MVSRMPDRGRTTREVAVGSTRLMVDSTGDGETVLLLHGFPHTRAIWRACTPDLVGAGYRVIAPDLRGVGDSRPEVSGYDAVDLASDLADLLDVLDVPTAHVVGFDFGAAPAFALAASRPEHVATLTIAEAMIGGLAGGAPSPAAGAPWWFGFHQVPDSFAEDVVLGSEERYIRFFLDTGSRIGVPADLADDLVEAYTGRERLHGAFEHYRAMPRNAGWNATWAATGRLRVPVAAVGAATLGDLPARQLATVADDLQEHSLPNAGHIVPIDAPTELAGIIRATAERRQAT